MTRTIEIGELVARRWRERGYDETAIADLAADALEDAHASGGLESLDEVAAARTFPEQLEMASGFGCPEIALFRNGYVSVHHCYAAALKPIAVRPHFAGAFLVTSGSFLSATYDFESTDVIQSDFELGHVHGRGAEILSAGAVRRIGTGPLQGRALVRLDPMSSIALIRTDELKIARSVRLLPPAVAIATGKDDPANARQRELLLYAARSGCPEGSLERIDAILQSDVRSWLLLVLDAVERAVPGSVVDRLVDVGERRVGHRIPSFRAVIDHARRLARFAQLLDEADERSERLALAERALSPAC
jgi:hypothetical protein